MPLQILVPLHTYPDGNSANLAAHVSAVALHLKADVHALVLNATFPTTTSLMGSMILNVDSMVQDVTAKCQTRGTALVLAMQTALQPVGIAFRSTRIDCVLGTISQSGAVIGRYHDLAVIGLNVDDQSLAATAETVVFGSGRPILVVPENLKPPAYQHIMIAWDGSRVAARAVADAHAFLLLAKTVTIAVVTDEKSLPDDNPGLKLVDYLARSNISATVETVQTQRHPIAQTLQDHAIKIGADMIVMGAFGHSRMRDFVMGGATAGVLHNLQLPVLLSH